MDPADWPGWSTSERIVAALAADRPDCLPGAYQDAGEAWGRIDDDQRAAVRETNLGMVRLCEAQADDARVWARRGRDADQNVRSVGR